MPYEDEDDNSCNSSQDADESPWVLVVGEKRSVTDSLRDALSGKPFLGLENVNWVFSSTNGHVQELVFESNGPTWNNREGCYDVARQIVLFDKPAMRVTCNEWVERSLLTCGEGADFVVLCLDNDLEGESIAAEVEEIVMPRLRPPRFGHNQIWRCRCSSLDRDTLQRAVELPPRGNLQRINYDFVAAVNVRRELDLRLGFAISRAVKHVVWNYLSHRSVNALDFDGIMRRCQDLEEYDSQLLPVLSYGPCQLPTLGFVEKSYADVSTFTCEPFWKVKVRCRFGADELIAWSEPLRQEDEASRQTERLRTFITQRIAATVEKTLREGYEKPLPLNTVRMLQLASDVLGLSPNDALNIAERLYLDGMISYPRTETTVYELSTDFEGIVNFLGRSAQVRVSMLARDLEQSGLEPPRQDGHFMDDHDPIMPTIDSRRPQEGTAADLYDLIARVFLASVSADAVIEQTSVVLELPFEGRKLRAIGYKVKTLGWIKVLPILDAEDSPLPSRA